MTYKFTISDIYNIDLEKLSKNYPYTINNGKVKLKILDKLKKVNLDYNLIYSLAEYVTDRQYIYGKNNADFKYIEEFSKINNVSILDNLRKLNITSDNSFMNILGIETLIFVDNLV